jgi:phosphatidylserine/phosphatidylglycerophosphate/cardiolipin synthase-like enzyme
VNLLFYREDCIFKLIIIFLHISIIGCTRNLGKNQYNYLLIGLLFPKNIEAHFSYPGRFTNQVLKENVVESILRLIDSANHSIVLYAYSLNHPRVIQALKHKMSAGIQIKLVLDKDKTYKELDNENIPYFKWNKSGLHHLKILIIDNEKVFLGTGNFTDPGLTNDWNGYISFHLEKEKCSEFIERLEERKNGKFNLLDMEFLFSPSEGILIQDKILTALDNAKESIQYLAFDHYDKSFSFIIKKKSFQGVKIDGIYNSPIDPEGIYLNEEMVGFDSKIYKDGNTDTIDKGNQFYDGGLLHHKTIIIDGEYLITGSYNYSLNARDNNREYILFTRNKYLVSEFQKEFNRIKNSSYLELPKDRNFFPTRNNLTIHHNDSESLCLDKHLIDAYIELGNSIFKTYLYYDKINSNCIIKKNYNTISSGISNFKIEKPILNSFLWENVKLFSRNGFQTIEINNIESNKNLFIPIKIDNFFINSSGNITLISKELNFNISNVYYWRIGRERIKVNFTKNNNSYFLETKISSIERDKGILFFEENQNMYLGCFFKKGNSSDTIDYIFHKLNYDNREEFSNNCILY